MPPDPSQNDAGLPLAYRRVKRRIRANLGSEWKVGDKLPSIEELARQFSTGRVNTYRAVRELADEGLLISRRSLGTFVAKAAEGINDEDALEAPLRGKRVLMPVFRPPRRDLDPFTRMGVTAIETALGDAGARVERQEHSAVASTTIELTDPHDAAVIFNPGSLHRLTPHARRPLVVINTAEETQVQADGGYDIIMVHSEHGGFLAGRHLREVGAQRPCFLGVHSGRHGGWTRTSLARLDGFENGWSARIDKQYLLACADYSEGEGAMAVRGFLSLDPRPDAIFAVTDEIAVGFITGALSHGLVVGRDYRIVGFDGQPRGRAVYGGPLTTIDAPLEEMARRAAEMIADRLSEPEAAVQRVALPGQLFVGRTTAKG